ncbi:DUF58 domain-containing protein [Myxococcota bacterium]|nr:DUF58 domain-containing protein [Myxococcota bacterium]MBU1381860.1 DUF58 domain-containing protein [Myxococcota bacterium]MBU1495595.1 DUF58 domain-containing protein [Myxococcota bacterium]
MISKELIRKVRKIEIKTNRLVNDMLAGQYQSVFKGRGMVFDEVRQYQPGDDIRLIDWNVTARTNDVFVKLFVEERELTIMLMVDMSASTLFGTLRSSKRELMAELSALLAFSAIKNNDRVGLIIFTDGIEKFVPPKKGRKHVLRVVTEILNFEPASRGSSINEALKFLGHVSKRKSVAFLLSDFLSPDYEHDLKIASKRHDLIPVTIIDKREEELPPLGLINVRDLETGEIITVDINKQVARSFNLKSKARREVRESLFRKLKMDYVTLYTGKEYITSLMQFFRRRERRMRG